MRKRSTLLSILWLTILLKNVVGESVEDFSSSSSSLLRRNNRSTTSTSSTTTTSTAADSTTTTTNVIQENGKEEEESLHQQQQQSTTTTATTSSNPRDLIVGGSSAEPHDYPYYVHIDTPGCGGTLIAPDIVLSAGHCMLDAISAYGTVKVGRYTKHANLDQSEEFTVIAQVRHPNFNGKVCCGSADGTWFEGVHYDFLLLKLSSQSTAQTIQLNKNGNIPRPFEDLHVVGFGDMDPSNNNFVTPDMIHEVTVNYRENDDCTGSNRAYPDYLLNEASMCAYDTGEDACGGDSGGPLIRKGRTDAQDVQVGIVSWGWGCADEPGIYARVSSEYQWVRNQVCSLSRNPPSSFACPGSSSSSSTTNGQSRFSSLPQHRFSRPKGTGIGGGGFRPNRPRPKKSNPNPKQEEQEAPEVPVPQPPNRGVLPSGSSTCSVAGTSLALCCSASLAPASDTDDADVCLPTSSSMIAMGSSCESYSWVLDNDPESYSVQICDSIMQHRTLLPEGRSCASVTDKNNCCQYLDNRNDGSIYHGQPCVASKDDGGFPDDDDGTISSGIVCQPANYVATFAPESVEDCSVLSPTTAAETADEGYIDISIPTTTETTTTTTNNNDNDTPARADLPEGRRCKTVKDPFVCCAAKDSRPESVKSNRFRGQDCVAAAPISPSSSPSTIGTTVFSSNNMCEPSGWAERRDSTKYDPDYCTTLVQSTRRALPANKSCNNLLTNQICCHYMDPHGQACVPSKGRNPFSSGNKCEPADWVAANEHNRAGECTGFY